MSALPDGWRETTLGEIVERGGGGIQTGPFGSQLHASDYVPVGVPSVMPQNIGDNVILEDGIARITDADVDRLSRYRLAPGDIVYSRRGDVERRALVREMNDGWLCGTGCLRVRVGDANAAAADPAFLSYVLGTEWTRAWIVRHAVGATMLNLNTAILSAVPLDLPPLAEQQAIAEVLGALDDKIAANTALAATADEFVRSWYMHALARGSVESLLFDQVSFDFGEPFKGDAFVAPGDGRPLIRIRDLKSFQPQVWTTERRQRETIVRPGDVLVGMDAEFRATPWLGEEGVLNQRVCRARGVRVGPAIVREALRAPLAAVESEKTGTTVIHLNKRDLERSRIVLPKPDQLRALEVVVQPAYESRVGLAGENRKLAALRDTLLPQLMSGKLRVRDAVEQVERAV